MSGRRRVTVWLSEAEWAVLEAAAVAAGVETGAVAREAVVRGAAVVARDVSAGRVKLRRRSPGLSSGRTAGSGPAGEGSTPSPGFRSLDEFATARAAAFRRALG
jgi:hypothetical protein